MPSQVLTLSPKLPKIQISYVCWVHGGGGRVSSQLLKLSPKLPKNTIPYVQWSRGCCNEACAHTCSVEGNPSLLMDFTHLRSNSLSVSQMKNFSSGKDDIFCLFLPFFIVRNAPLWGFNVETCYYGHHALLKLIWCV